MKLTETEKEMLKGFIVTMFSFFVFGHYIEKVSSFLLFPAFYVFLYYLGKTSILLKFCLSAERLKKDIKKVNKVGAT